jgi:hypothetical protein
MSMKVMIAGVEFTAVDVSVRRNFSLSTNDRYFLESFDPQLLSKVSLSLELAIDKAVKDLWYEMLVTQPLSDELCEEIETWLEALMLTE